MNLNEQLWAVAKEYARQFAQIIDANIDHWVGEESGEVFMCCFGDFYYFSLNDMQVVVNNLERYVEQYGSRQAVGNAVRKWVDWWISDVPETLIEYTAERTTFSLKPRIPLKTWLDSTPPDGIRPWGRDMSQLCRLHYRKRVIGELIDENGPGTRLADIYSELTAEIQVTAERIKKNNDKTSEIAE